MTEPACSRPRVSAVIPVYNGERYLREAIESALAQDYPDLEVIVVDDGSSDSSAAIAGSYVDAAAHPLRYHYQPNAGLSAAQNAGVREATGEFIAFLDCDDLWPAGKTSLQMAAFEGDPQLDMVFGHAEQFLSPELQREPRAASPPDSKILPGYSTGTMMARRSVFERVGLFSSAYRIGEFLDWYGRASDAGLRSRMLEEVLLRRRIHRDNMGIRDRDKRSDYLRVFKAALDRRRQGPGEPGKGPRS